jgi:hypothetical protein
MIGLAQASRIYAGLFWRRLRRGRLIGGAAVLALGPAVIAGIGVAGGRWGAGLFHEALELYLRLLLPLGPVLLASPVVGEELEQNTHTYLFARPAPRSALVLGKCATAALVLMPVYAIGVLATFAVSVLLPATYGGQVNAGDVGSAAATLPGALFGVLLGVPVFTGVAAGVGTLLPRRPMLAGFLYILVMEELFGNLPGVLKALSVSFYIRSIAGMVGNSLFHLYEPEPGPLLAALIALGIGAGWLLLAMRLVVDAEYRESR